eukprot:TRINITY_DN59645_c0_g1_i1.p1 TRINITY_DN59645_c0_g1~~TRINITY_DN59645_c0_g1_i1.p1  ORF type:complete len:243 (+),score=8.69 TRINITY_DN59645_c0_g1_i1:54-731(+)
MAMIPGTIPTQAFAMPVATVNGGMPFAQPVQTAAVVPAMTYASPPPSYTPYTPAVAHLPVQQVQAIVHAQPRMPQILPQPIVREVPMHREVLREFERPPLEGRVVAERPIGREELYASGNLLDGPTIFSPSGHQESFMFERPFVRPVAPAPLHVVQGVQTYPAPVQTHARPFETYGASVQTYGAPAFHAGLSPRPVATVGAGPIAGSPRIIGGGIGGMGGGLLIG